MGVQAWGMGEPVDITINGESVSVISADVTVENNLDTSAIREPAYQECDDCGSRIKPGAGWYVISMGDTGRESGIYCNECHE